MPRKNTNAGLRSYALIGPGAQAPYVFIPPPLGRPKVTRRPGGRR